LIEQKTVGVNKMEITAVAQSSGMPGWMVAIILIAEGVFITVGLKFLLPLLSAKVFTRPNKDRRKYNRLKEDQGVVPCKTANCNRYELFSNDISEIKTQVAKLAEHLDEIWTQGLRKDFYNESLSLSERLLSGLTYVWWIEHTGKDNGRTKNAVTAMAWKHPDLYDMATRKEPKLKINDVEKKYKIDSLN
jgi:hypothetical protein